MDRRFSLLRATLFSFADDMDGSDADDLDGSDGEDIVIRQDVLLALEAAYFLALDTGKEQQHEVSLRRDTLEQFNVFFLQAEVPGRAIRQDHMVAFVDSVRGGLNPPTIIKNSWQGSWGCGEYDRIRWGRNRKEQDAR